jgi:hypothetical protein
VVEIVDRFYEKVREKQEELGIDAAIMNDLDNVRPQSAIGDWLNWIDQEGRLNPIYDGTIASFLINHPGEVASLAMNVISGKYQPDLLQAAKDLAINEGWKYVIFGHTHNALDKDLGAGIRHLNSGTWRKFIEPKGPPSTRMRTVPTYNEGEIQFYTQEPYYYYEFNSTIKLSHILFNEEGEGEIGPHLIQQEKEAPES